AIKRFSPDSLSIMEFKSQITYQVAEKIYANHPLLGETLESGWNVKFTREFDITNDRHLFNTQGKGLPLYEGKMIHQFDANFAEPKFWLEEQPASERLASKYSVSSSELDYLKPRLAYRGIASSTNSRTLMTTILPPRVFSEGRSATTVKTKFISEKEQLFACACLNALPLDWILRQKVAANVNMFHMYSLPLPRLTVDNPYFDALVSRAACLTCVRDDFADLWQDVMGTPFTPTPADTPLDVPTNQSVPSADLKPNLNRTGWQPVVNEAKRQIFRNEIDALVAHLYGLSHDEFAHILATFPLVFADDAVGKTKKEALLAVYDTFADTVKDWSRA
ncbi:MAG: ATP-binding protein, partial [Anaerolineae bacterium]|nr:ATP-binding protein [Anaerolineae bacterium]